MALMDSVLRELRSSITEEGKELGRHIQALRLLANGNEPALKTCPGCGRPMEMDEAARQPAMAGGGRRTTSRRRGTTRSRSRSRTARNGTGDPSNRILELVMAGTHRGPEIAEGAAVHYRTALRHLEGLAQEGAIMRQGERNDTRWMPTEAAAGILEKRREAAGAAA